MNSSNNNHVEWVITKTSSNFCISLANIETARAKERNNMWYPKRENKLPKLPGTFGMTVLMLFSIICLWSKFVKVYINIEKSEAMGFRHRGDEEAC